MDGHFLLRINHFSACSLALNVTWIFLNLIFLHPYCQQSINLTKRTLLPIKNPQFAIYLLILLLPQHVTRLPSNFVLHPRKNFHSFTRTFFYVPKACLINVNDVMEWKIHHYLTMIVNVQINWIKNLQFICKDFTIWSSICMNLILRPFVSISKAIDCKKLQIDVNKRIKSRIQKHVIISLPFMQLNAS